MSVIVCGSPLVRTVMHCPPCGTRRWMVGSHGYWRGTSLSCVICGASYDTEGNWPDPDRNAPGDPEERAAWARDTYGKASMLDVEERRQERFWAQAHLIYDPTIPDREDDSDDRDDSSADDPPPWVDAMFEDAPAGVMSEGEAPF